MFLHKDDDRALSRVELLVILVCIVIVVTIAAIALMGGQRADRLRALDRAQMRVIYDAWVTMAQEDEGRFPTPSAEHMKSALGIETTARRNEDVSLNTTANLFSLCIMQNRIKPEHCVNPREPNPVVQPCPTASYDFNAYKPATGVAWDTSFTADLQTGSNVSYAHMPIHGALRIKHWRLTPGGSRWPLLGNRGPCDGIPDPASFTYRQHPPDDQWSGQIVFADGSVRMFIGLPQALDEDQRVFNAQGVYRFDGEDDSDGILTFTQRMSRDGPTIQHD